MHTREGHKCPRCQQWTTEKCYCPKCVKVLRDPGKFGGRSYRPFFKSEKNRTLYGRRAD